MRVRQTTASEAEAFVRKVTALARVVPVSGTLRLCRDPDDDMLLETATSGEATHIVSRDEDITRDQELVRQLGARGIKVVTVRQLLAMLNEEMKNASAC